MCGLAIEVPLLVSHRLPKWLGGPVAATTSTPGAMMSGLSRSPPLDVGRAAGRERGDRRAPGSARRVGADIAAVAPAAVAGVRLDRGAGHLVDVHGRHQVVVGVERVRGRVVEDHPDAAGVLHRRALVHAGVVAAHAEHDLPGHLGRVELRRVAHALRGQRRVGAGQTGVAPRRPAARTAAAAPTPTPSKVRPSPSVTVLVDVRSWVPAATVVTHGMPLSTVPDARAVVAGGRGDEHARRGGVEERELDRRRTRRCCRRSSS